MTIISTIWNARAGGIEPAVRQLHALGYGEIELASRESTPDLAEATKVVRELKLLVRGVDGALGRATGQAGWTQLDDGFASTDPTKRDAHIAALRRVAAIARRAGTGRVVVRCGRIPIEGIDERWIDWRRRTSFTSPDDALRDEAAAMLVRRATLRDEHLDAACRTIYALRRVEPEIEWRFLAADRLDALPMPDEAEFLLAEFPSGARPLVVDVSAASILESIRCPGGFEEWAKSYDSRLAALRLADAFGLETGMLPGAGSVNWTPVCEAAGMGVERVVHVTQDSTAGELIEAVRFLDGLGLS